MIALRKILVPTDFSEFSQAAIRYGQELATRFQAELHLIHVLEFHPTLTPTFELGLALPSQIQESRTVAEQTLARLPGETSLSCVRAVLEGKPVLEILRYARENEIDLLVATTHGRTGLAHVLMGSVAENLVRMATCPVLTVRPNQHGFVMP
ncbi:MAG: universal stress protein [Planctomycetaceae bacterium]|nr:universal stress protein [Planctomycetaceae bacterium]